MRQNTLQLVDAGYVGELFPFVVEGNHGSEDGTWRRYERNGHVIEEFVPLEDDGDWAYCGVRRGRCLVKYGCQVGNVACRLRQEWDARRCLMSECNGWRWYHFEVLQGIRDWVMT